MTDTEKDLPALARMQSLSLQSIFMDHLFKFSAEKGVGGGEGMLNPFPCTRGPHVWRLNALNSQTCSPSLAHLQKPTAPHSIPPRKDAKHSSLRGTYPRQLSRGVGQWG